MVRIHSEDFYVCIFFNASQSALVSYRIFPRFDHRGHPGGQFHGNSIKSRNDWKLTQTPNLRRFSLRSPQKRLFNNRATIFSVLSLALTWGWAMMLLINTNAYPMLSILHHRSASLWWSLAWYTRLVEPGPLGSSSVRWAHFCAKFLCYLDRWWSTDFIQLGN